MTGRDWVLARTQPRREAWAAQNVRRYHQRDYYLPSFEEEGTGKVKFLWPSYIFVHCPDGLFHFLHGTYGISRVVMLGNTVARVSNDFIERLQKSEVAGRIQLPRKPSLEIGDRVKVEYGPYGDLFGIYQGVGTKDRVKVLFDILGRSVVTSVDRAAVTAL